jgi:nucleotide-binding universal stress UspA family protein
MKKPNIKTLLVPIDFSVMSIQAVETAKRLARPFEARIHLLHVQDAMYPAGFAAPAPTLMNDVIAILRQNEKKLRERLRDLSPDDCHVLTDPAAFDSICRTARDLSIDLDCDAHAWPNRTQTRVSRQHG